MSRILVLSLMIALTARAEDPPIDAAKTAERIVQDATQASKQLSEKDAGAKTQQLQKDVLKNIDALIRKSQEPPPMSKNDMSQPPPKDGMNGAKPPPQGGSDSSVARRERREQAKSKSTEGGENERQPFPMNNAKDKSQEFGGPMNNPNKIEAKGQTPRAPDFYKDVWGHLPEKMRQEMDSYFREQFMPRYSEMLRDYYSSLAERSSKNGLTP